MELSKRMQYLAGRDRFSFHMPGHKGRFPSLFGNFDPTELPGLDNLHDPRGVISRAQGAVADLYGAAKSYFLVNGSSVGLMAAITALAGPGDCVLVPRGSHKSIIAGLVHSGAMPVWLEQPFCPELQHWLPPTFSEVQSNLAAHPIKAAVFANPDYYGFVPPLSQLAALCRREGVALIADEAHGAHLAWGRDIGLPEDAVTAGCTIAVQSPHKTLPALTQAAWLHLTDPALAGRMQETLNLFQTTSPSYLLLRSLEYAGAWARAHGAIMLGRLQPLAKILSLRSRQLGLDFAFPAGNRDWTKFLLPWRQKALRLLRRQGIYPELAQGKALLFMLTMADALDPAGIAALHESLAEIAKLPGRHEVASTSLPIPPQEITPREAWQRAGKLVAVPAALGRIVRQIIAPYPPGTLVAGPGQRLGSEHIDFLKKLQAEKVISQWLEVI